jgi:hypothetical protein
LLRRGVAQDEIGIITPYNAQADLIRQQVDALVEVHTIDKYQVNITVLHGQVIDSTWSLNGQFRYGGYVLLSLFSYFLCITFPSNQSHAYS